MTNSKEKTYTGTGATLEKATAHAWENARASGAKPGKFVIQKIEIETENPIRSYTSTISPVPKG
jgi:hypothetical protein